MFNIERFFSWVIFSLGFTSISVQIVFLREFLSVFYGNELVIGVILANWMMLIGAGAFIGKLIIFKEYKKSIVNFLILISILPLISVFFLNFLRNIIFDVGVQLSISEIFWYSLLIMFPFCLVSGFFFTYLSSVISEKYSQNLIGRVYSIESVGSVIAGILMSLVLSIYLSNIQILILIFLFNLTIALVISFIWNFSFYKIFILILATSIVMWNYFFHFDKKLKEMIFPEQKIEYYRNTPYGSLVITETQNQRNIYENSLLLFSTNDPISNEEAVHYAMVQSQNPENVLLVSGGISGTIEEVLKYDVKKIDYVEINPFIIKIKDYFSDKEFDNRVFFAGKDARLYVKNTEARYDVALINLPEPSTAQINRYYTDEFLKELKSKLNPNAVVSYSLSSAVDYLSPEARRFKSVIYNTLKNNFKNVLIIAGYRDFFICSDGELIINIPALIDERKIENLYVNKYYLDTDILKQRSDFILKNIEETNLLNTDFNPITYYHQIILWLSQFGVDYRYVLLFLGLLLLVFLLRMDVISYGMFAGGFAASGVEFLLLIAFQIIYGYVYQMIGLIIAVFMLGLAIGAYFQSKYLPSPKLISYAKIQFLIFIISSFIPVVIISLNNLLLGSGIIFFVIVVFTSIIGCLVGFEFATAVNIKKGKYENIASEIYSVDMIGSAIGSFVVTVFLFPLLGFVYSGLLIGGMNLVGSVLTFLKRG
ncbi:MAG: Spermidine synthase [Ignavibacteriae bacterium]|nr:MAG: Spermidine synthase [Ignavibacteriota bacterium]